MYGLEIGAWVALAALMLTSCAATRDKIVLLPNKDGSSSALIIKTKSGERVLDQPYAAANIAEGGEIKSQIQSAETISARYARTLEAQPARESTYVLYFPFDSVELTAESRVVLQRVKEDLRSRPVPEILVVGHADAVADDAYNDALSLERAKAMSKLLIAEGFSSEKMALAGRGKREPIIKTASGKREPRNRRVEIIVK